MNKAIFLDRDGVINGLIFNSERNEYEPPHKTTDLKLLDGVIDVLKMFIENGYKLFIVSNQPDYAKGKTTLENLKEVHNELHRILIKNNILFTDYFYCYHHPEGIVREYSFDCECRKPKTYFILKAISDYNINKNNSWFIGDRDTDIECGKRSGLKTILVGNKYDINTKKFEPDFFASDLIKTSEIILEKIKDR
ncbi:MAG: HAD-IIIA family hydrolase [Bacteroidota bacterium]|nr:HAD-IIIA family hydrolase [Bacteroidota bacterium]